MRAPIGITIRNRRKSLGISQAGLARRVGISASYLNLIEANKREVGGTLVGRLAQALDIGVEQLSGEAEERLIHSLEELLADPVLEPVGMQSEDVHQLVAQNPRAAAALARLHRGYGEAMAGLEAQANRLRADPMLSQQLHQILSHITAMRSSAEILDSDDDLAPEDRRRFVGRLNREAVDMSEVARALIGQFERSSEARRSISPRRELDDLIIEQGNYFPALEAAAKGLREEVERSYGRLGSESLADLLEQRFGIVTIRGARGDEPPPPAQFTYDASTKTMWFAGSTTVSTRRFQLARLLTELSLPDVLDAQSRDPRLTSAAARRLAYRAMAAYAAGAMLFPYDAFLEAAEDNAYDIDFLGQTFTGSFEQVAHRLVTLRRPGAEGVPFGFLRSDPAGRLTKQFPLPGLPLPNSGHACPLWAIYGAFRTPGQVVRQVVRFAEGSRYLFVAKTVSKRLSTYRDQPFHSSIMLACDILQADRTVYGRGLDLADSSVDVPVGPTCRMCVRRDCNFRQEEIVDPGSDAVAIGALLVPRSFDLGD